METKINFVTFCKYDVVQYFWWNKSQGIGGVLDTHTVHSIWKFKVEQELFKGISVSPVFFFFLIVFVLWFLWFNLLLLFSYDK